MRKGHRAILQLSYDPSNGEWQTLQPYSLELESMGCSLMIPQGFRFEASVPIRLDKIFPRRGLGILGPLAHDFIYTYDGKMPSDSVVPYRRFTRAEADRIFLELMTEEKISRPRRYLAWLAVRMFGFTKWDNTDK